MCHLTIWEEQGSQWIKCLSFKKNKRPRTEKRSIYKLIITKLLIDVNIHLIEILFVGVVLESLKLQVEILESTLLGYNYGPCWVRWLLSL